MQYQKFIFEKFELNKQTGEISFFYSLDKKINFVEKIKFDAKKIIWKKINDEILNNAIYNLHLILGISYYKTYCPKQIVINSGSLNKTQAQFWNKLYTNGLGEYFYKNKIDFRNLVSFPYKNIKIKSAVMHLKNRSLVPIGGGKDSVVTSELLKENNFVFDLISLRDSTIQKTVSKKIGAERIIIGREMDKQLAEINQAGAYNGHIPISAIYFFLCALAAIIYDYKYIVFSNEKSANYGNVSYLGKKINHQYSKSFEFEKNFNDYVHKFITPNVHSFSLLRPLSELKIVEIFSKYKKYFPIFSSCNRNFKISGGQKARWCGECPKCAFMFSQLAAFIPKKELIKIFNKNLYAQEKILELYLELAGEKNIKPFDCVGTPEEVKAAMYLAWQNKEYENDHMIKYFAAHILPKTKNIKKITADLLAKFGQDIIPENFIKIKKIICAKK
jgi:UDP-N-acetyl-alpha-D-muramoyl-L-alanyl-L-glutamate epimerase